jgi:pimeloyl-ACP methyl ester carboxylesterase
LRALLAERLPDYMVPAGFVELEALPLTTNGKLDRKALPSPSFSGDGQQRVAPSTDLERQLHAIWAAVLGHGEFGTSDNFFSIGGHSLAAARLVSRIEENLGQRLPLASLFQSPTLAALASRLTDGVVDDHRSFRSLVIVQGQGESSPLFVVHGGGGDVFIHVHLARCLAPRRPVYGLQAVGIDGSEARHRTVEEMASHYASEILRLRPQGPFHLLGYSGGGWYAWAVAAEILRRGGCLGLIGLVDTRGTADLHRRLRLQQLLLNGTQQLLRQLSRWRDSPSLPQRNSLRRKLEAFRFHSWTLLRTPGGIAPNALDPDAMPRPTQPLGGDYFIQLHTYYRPPRLPVRADIFSTPSAENNQRKLWNFYATGEVYLHPALLDHNDYYSADFMPAFAERLDALINDIESQQP